MPLNSPAVTLTIRTLILCALCSSAYSVQPMSESDLEVVSATTGDNILNIFGASQAGLKVDSDERVEPGSATLSTESKASLNKEQFQEGESVSNVAAMELRDIEKKTSSNREPANSVNLDQSVQNNIVLSNESTTKSSSAYSTNSEPSRTPIHSLGMAQNTMTLPSLKGCRLNLSVTKVTSET